MPGLMISSARCRSCHLNCLLNDFKIYFSIRKVTNGVPFKHEKISEWQDAKHKGIKFKDEKSGITFTGGIDDLWLDLETNKIVIVDYKATAKEKGVPDNILDTEFYVNYKIQIDFYAWLFKKNGFDICENSYFIFFNGNYHKKTFDNVMEFEPKLIHYTNDTSWIDKKLKTVKP